MLDMGFLPQVRKIVNLCPWDERQTLLFSATMPAAIQTFAQWCLTDPISVEIAKRAVASTVTHAFYPVAMDQRDELLVALLDGTEWHSVIIFTRTRKEADQVTDILKESGHPKVVAMHSDVSQKDRMEALQGFRDGKYDVLVATDVAARGIDISGVSHVINYRVPENAEDYVHRIGRTGRAEAEGDAFTILTADELDYAKSVEVYVDQKIPRKKLENFAYTYTAMLDDEPIRQIRRKSSGPKKRR
jgi:ATP-dependent RNA helicase RhlE